MRTRAFGGALIRASTLCGMNSLFPESQTLHQSQKRCASLEATACGYKSEHVRKHHVFVHRVLPLFLQHPSEWASLCTLCLEGFALRAERPMWPISTSAQVYGQFEAAVFIASGEVAMLSPKTAGDAVQNTSRNSRVYRLVARNWMSFRNTRWRATRSACSAMSRGTFSSCM